MPSVSVLPDKSILMKVLLFMPTATSLITQVHNLKFSKNSFHVPVAVNDVNSAALGEAVFGAGKKNSFLCLTYGTGVGGAIVENKQVYHGSSFSAGDLCAIITHAEEKLSGTDPFDRCYERYASATALVKMVSTVDSSVHCGRQIFASLKRPKLTRLLINGLMKSYLVLPL